MSCRVRLKSCFWFLLLLAIPWGVALQNILLVLAAVILLGSLLELVTKNLEIVRGLKLKDLGLGLLLSAFAMQVSFLAATFFYPLPRLVNLSQSFWGYGIWIFFPTLVALGYQVGAISAPPWARLARFLSILVLLWSLVVCSQALWGWRVLGTHFVSDELRPRGLYSHPLTLAYAALLLFPVALNWVLLVPRSFYAWSMFVGSLVIVILSQSRTVQTLAFASVVWSCLYFLAGKKRWLFIATLLVGVSTVLVTDNLVSRKLVKTFSGEGVDRFSSYPDDRFAFWHAHWEMIKERPWLGHGYDLNTAFRKPYYEQIGLGDFEKQYEAHNQYIQVLAQGGLVGLAFFLLWVGNCFKLICKITNRTGRFTALQIFVTFLAGLSLQNALSDASVRLVLTVFLTAVLLGNARRELT